VPDGSRVWTSSPWFFRPERMFLIPGDSPMGLRLPLDSLPWVKPSDYPRLHEQDPLAPRPPLPGPRARSAQRFVQGVFLADLFE
jgi:uncharacterized protein (DUF2126 family)